MSSRIKDFQDLSFSDDFMFWKVMTTRKKICIGVMEVILGVKVKDVVYAKGQDTQQITPSTKGVRFDVRVDDDAGTVYDIEMQTSKQNALPHRMRYYQGILDISSIEPGQDYSELPNSKIIFICLGDQFGKGRQIYRFRCYDSFDKNLELGDNTEKIVLNASAERDNENKDLSDFLEFVRTGNASGGLSEDIEQAIEDIKQCANWEAEYMTFVEKLKEEYTAGKKDERNLLRKLISVMREDHCNDDQIDRVIFDDVYYGQMLQKYHIS